MKQLLLPLMSFAIGIISCNNQSADKTAAQTFSKGSFKYDLDFLNKFDSIIVLKAGNTRVAVSPRYQGKVFTSTTGGPQDPSFGWINYTAFGATPDPHMNAFGGENRLWLGPEGNRFSLFFEKGKTQVFDNWKTPAPFDSEPWDLDSRSDTTVALSKKMDLVNYAGTPFTLEIKRKVRILDDSATKRLFMNITPGSSVRSVAYESDNTMKNTGANAWTEASGAPCIWMLDMFPPSDSATIIIPCMYLKELPHTVTADYFGQIPPDRLVEKDGFVYLKADGKSRGKLGISSAAAPSIAGSYDPVKKLLTVIIFYTTPFVSHKWLNQEWASTKPPYQGDAVNAYNDGPLANGKQMGPFYELESVSPAAFLKPGDSLSHKHIVIHFTGERTDLDILAKQTLNISLSQVKNAFTKTIPK
jgi:hypothetical protein